MRKSIIRQVLTASLVLAVTPVAAVSWAAALGMMNLGHTPLGFLGAPTAPWIISAIALVELITDKLPKTPSRTAAIQFGARLLTGGLAGAAVGVPWGAVMVGIPVGMAGAVLGTFGGAAARGALARAFGRDLPAALVEDFVAIAGAAIVVCYLV